MANEFCSVKEVGLPLEIEKGYQVDLSAVEPLSGGIVNQTFKIKAFGEVAILQQLGPVFDERTIEDFDAVTNYLERVGWAVPRPILTIEGGLSVRDSNDRLWRAMSYINSDLPTDFELSPKLLTQTGALLADFHRDLSTLDYQPKFTIPDLHDTKMHIEKLIELYEELTPDGKLLADEILERRSAFCKEYDTDTEQLVHGDPKLANILFRDRQPFTFIDLDTVMKDSFWVDLGDMLRSLSKSYDTDMVVKYVAEGYRLSRFPDLSEETFVVQAIMARQRLVLELATRYLNDSVEDYYFDWDNRSYPSRNVHNVVRAKAQWGLFKQTESQKLLTIT